MSKIWLTKRLLEGGGAYNDFSSGEDPIFGQIRIQGSVPRTKGDI